MSIYDIHGPAPSTAKVCTIAAGIFAAIVASYVTTFWLGMEYAFDLMALS